MTRQEALNRVWQVFVVDKAPQSRAAGLGCAYGHPDDTTGCAVACLCDREARMALHQWETDPQTPTTTIVNFPDYFRLGLGELDKDFLDDLQDAHDSAEPVTDFAAYIEPKLRRLAADKGLTVPE